MEGLQLVNLILDLPKFLKWVNSILEQVHLLAGIEMSRRVNQGLIQSYLLLPIE